MDIDTTNDFLVGVQGADLVVTRPPVGRITKPQALRLAAYLVVLAEDLPGEFDGILAAIRNT